MSSAAHAFITAYCTTGSIDEARTIANEVVRQRLVACVNILPALHSVYAWKDDVCEDQEAALIMKTRSELFGPLSERIRQLHSYDCPCITAMPIVLVSDDYAAWLRDQTRSSDGHSVFDL